MRPAPQWAKRFASGAAPNIDDVVNSHVVSSDNDFARRGRDSRLHAAHLGGDMSPSPSIVDDAPPEHAALQVAFFAVDRETVHGATARMSRSIYAF